MPLDEFKSGFFIMSVHYIKDGWDLSYYEAKDGHEAIYEFQVTRPMNGFI
jgi:hypothetical protein